MDHQPTPENGVIPLAEGRLMLGRKEIGWLTLGQVDPRRIKGLQQTFQEKSISGGT